MCIMNSCNPLLEQEEIKEKVELSPSMNLPTEKTVYFSSRTPLDDFKLPHLVWGSRNLLECVETNNKSTPVSKPCLKAKQSKRQVNKGLVVRERSVRRREGLFSFSLRKEEIEEDFIRVTGRMPHRKMKFKDVKEDKEYLKYQKYLQQIVPGNWLSEIYRV